MSFPSALPSYTTPTSGETLAAAGHTNLHVTEEADIIGIATKVGPGASIPTSNSVLVGNGAGTSAWGQVNLTNQVSGVLPTTNGGTGTTSTTGSGSNVFNTSPTLVTPSINGGTWTGSPTISTPTIADFTNAQHNHQNAAGGGVLSTAALSSNTVSVSRLSSVESTDLFSGTTLTQNTWTDLRGNQNFTVDNANSTVLAWLNIGVSLGGSGTPAVGGRIVIDGTANYMLGNGKVQTAASFVNPFQGAGVALIPGLTAGTHTVKSQVFSDSASTQVFLRASSVPNVEFLTTNVLELKK